MYRILFVGNMDQDNLIMEKKLSRNVFYKVEMATSTQNLVDRVKGNDYHLLIFNFDVLTTEKMNMAQKIREAGCSAPVLVISKKVLEGMLKQAARTSRLIFLEKPYEEKDLFGIIFKMLQTRKVEQRIHRRFYTNQRATLRVFGRGEDAEGRVYNLSRGGAYLESGDADLKTGDVISLDVDLKQHSKSYKMHCQVVWTTEKGMWTGGPGAGVSFVKPADVYRSLLQKI